MMRIQARYISCFLMLVAALIVTELFFNWQHLLNALAQPFSQGATPYWFTVAGLPAVFAFGWSNINRFRSNERVAANLGKINNWHELAAISDYDGERKVEIVGFLAWADKIAKSSPQTGVPPDCEGWLQREFDGTPQQTTIRTISSILIILGVVFTFQGINLSTRSLTAAIQGADPRLIDSLARLFGSPVWFIDVQAADQGLLGSLTTALGALSASFGANLNGILFAIDFFVLGLCIQTLDEDVRRVVRTFVLDHAEPLLQAELAQCDPTHQVLRELSQNQINVVADMLAKLPELLNAATHDALEETLANINRSVNDLALRSATAAEDAAKSTGERLAASVSKTFSDGVEQLKAVIKDDLSGAIVQSSAMFSAEFEKTVRTVGDEHRKAARESADQIRNAAVLAVEPLANAGNNLRDAFQKLIDEQDATRRKNSETLWVLETQLESTIKRVTATLATGLAELSVHIDDTIPNALDRAVKNFSGKFGDTLDRIGAAHRDAVEVAAGELKTATAEAAKSMTVAGSALDASADNFTRTFGERTKEVAKAISDFQLELQSTGTELNDAAKALFEAAEKVEGSTKAQAGSLTDWRSATDDFMAAATAAGELIRPLANTLETLQSNFGKQVVQASDATTEARKIQVVLTKLAASLEGLPQQMLQVNTELAATSQKLTEAQAGTTAIPAAIAAGFQKANQQFAQELNANFAQLAAGAAPEFAKQLEQLNNEIGRLIIQLRAVGDGKPVRSREPPDGSDDDPRPTTPTGAGRGTPFGQPQFTVAAKVSSEHPDEPDDPAVAIAEAKRASAMARFIAWGRGNPEPTKGDKP